MNKKRLNILGLILIVILGISSIVLIANYRKSVAESNSSFTTLVPRDYDDTDSNYTTDFSIIEDGLRDMGFLVTQEYYFTQVEEYTKSKKIAFITSKSSFTYSYDGVVEAGIDFAKINVTVDEKKSLITIALPEAEIHSITVDEDSFKEYDDTSKFWNPIKPQDFNKAQKEFKANAEKKAIERGVLDKANEQAQTIIKNFVIQLVGSSYTIEFK